MIRLFATADTINVQSSSADNLTVAAIGVTVTGSDVEPLSVNDTDDFVEVDSPVTGADGSRVDITSLTVTNNTLATFPIVTVSETINDVTLTLFSSVVPPGFQAVLQGNNSFRVAPIPVPTGVLQITAGDNITLTPAEGEGVVEVAASGGGGGSVSVTDAGNGNVVVDPTPGTGTFTLDLGNVLVNIAAIEGPAGGGLELVGGTAVNPGDNGGVAAIVGRAGANNGAGQGGLGGPGEVISGNGGSATAGNNDGGDAGNVELNPGTGGAGFGTGVAGADGVVKVNNVQVFDASGNLFQPGGTLTKINTITSPPENNLTLNAGATDADGQDGPGVAINATQGALNTAGNAGRGGYSVVEAGGGGNATGGDNNGGDGGNVELDPGNGGSGHGTGTDGANGFVTVTGNKIFDIEGNPVFIGSSQVTVTSSQFDKTNDTTLADIPILTANVEAGGVYTFEATLFTVSNIGTGVKAAIGGTCTVTSIIYEGTVYSAGVSVASAAARTTTKGNAVGGITAVTVARIDIKGSIVVNAGGTLTVQFAENAGIAATVSSVLINSSFTVTRTPIPE